VRNSGALKTGQGTGIGLRNCRERLAVLYGADAELTLEAEPDSVCAHVSLPWQVQAP
jgi:sensor histidine kinase YesM